jgi:hypothetical protein
MAMADGVGLPLAIHTAAATPHEVTLVPGPLAATLTAERPDRLSGDPPYASAPLDAEWAAAGMEMIAPQRAHRLKPATQAGRPLRRYRRRWLVERLFAWGRMSGVWWCIMSPMPPPS